MQQCWEEKTVLNWQPKTPEEQEYMEIISQFLHHQCGDHVCRKDAGKRLVEYIHCIEMWGESHNIVSGKYQRIDLLKNIYDSLAGGALIGLPGEVFDAGSGGGFPAVPLAILYPHIQFCLVESSRKKCSFLRMVRSALALKNVTILNRRVEELAPQSMVISKAAFSAPNLKVLVSLCRPLGQLALWSTPKSQEQVIRAALSNGARLEFSHTYVMPESGQRSILVFRRLG